MIQFCYIAEVYKAEHIRGVKNKNLLASIYVKSEPNSKAGIRVVK